MIDVEKVVAEMHLRGLEAGGSDVAILRATTRVAIALALDDFAGELMREGDRRAAMKAKHRAARYRKEKP